MTNAAISSYQPLGDNRLINLPLYVERRLAKFKHIRFVFTRTNVIRPT